jgi:hypothetical protein
MNKIIRRLIKWAFRNRIQQYSIQQFISNEMMEYSGRTNNENLFLGNMTNKLAQEMLLKDFVEIRRERDKLGSRITMTIYCIK